MLNFETLGKEYRERIQWRVDDLFDRIIVDYLLKGGGFDAQKVTKMFGTACRVAQLQTDLEIGTGLLPLKEKKYDENSETPVPNAFVSDGEQEETPTAVGSPTVGNEVGDLGTRDSEGPTGSDGDAVGVCDPISEPDQINHHGPTGSGEVNPFEQQRQVVVPGPGTGRGHSGGPEGTEVHPATGDGPDGVGPGVPDVR